MVAYEYMYYEYQNDDFVYKFDIESVRWRLDKAIAKEKEYSFRGDIWKEIKKEIDQ